MDSGIELRHLRYAIAAAEQGSFRRAAAILGIQVSVLSRCIRDLEDRVGASLFNRRSHGVQLTFAGKRFIQRADRLMTDLKEALDEAEVAGAGREGILRIGVLSSPTSAFPATLLNVHRAIYADVETVYTEASTVDHILAIRQNRLDIAFLAHAVRGEGCDSVRLWSERVFVAMAANNPLCHRESVQWSDLDGLRLVFSATPPGPELQKCVMKRLVGLGIQPNVALLAVYRDTVMHVVAGGVDVTVVGEARATEPFRGVVYRPLQGESLSFHAVWLPDNDNPALRRFLSLARVLAKPCANCVAWTDHSESCEGDQSDSGTATRHTRAVILRERLGRLLSIHCIDCLLRNFPMD